MKRGDGGAEGTLCEEGSGGGEGAGGHLAPLAGRRPQVGHPVREGHSLSSRTVQPDGRYQLRDGDSRERLIDLVELGPHVGAFDPSHESLVLPQDPDGQHVRRDHDEQRNVEREHRAVDDEVRERGHAQPAVEHHRCVDEAVDAQRAADRHGDDPHEQDLGEHHRLGLVAAVPHRVLEREEPVHGHGAHVPDGCGAHENVAGDPEDT